MELILIIILIATRETSVDSSEPISHLHSRTHLSMMMTSVFLHIASLILTVTCKRISIGLRRILKHKTFSIKVF